MSDVENTLISLNNLEYSLPESLSVVVTKQHKSFPALKRDYSAESKIDFVLSAGQQYIDTNESFITFQLRIDGLREESTGNPKTSQEYKLSSDGKSKHMYMRHVMDLFNMVRLTHASGTVLYEDDYFNHHWLHDKALELDKVKFEEIQDQGHGYPIDVGAGNNPGDYTGSTKTNCYSVKSTPHFYWKQPTMYANTTGQLIELGGAWCSNAFKGSTASNDLAADNTGWGNVNTQTFTILNPYDASKSIVRFVKFATYNEATSATIAFTIPLWWFPCFRNDSNSLMPSMLVNGSRLELNLESIKKWGCFGQCGAFLNVDPNINYAIENPQMHLSLVDLSSRIFAVLLQESINNGLEWSFDSTYTVPQTDIQSSSFTMEATRALSRVKTVKVIPFSASAVSASTDWGDENKDARLFKAGKHISFFTPNYGDFFFKKWRFTLGSMSYPANDVRMDTTDQARLQQTLNHARNAYGWNQSKMGCAIGLYDFEEGAFYQAVQSLERSSSLQQSGLSLSMDASLRFMGEFGGGGVSPYIPGSASCYLFVTFSTVIVIIGDKVIVKS